MILCDDATACPTPSMRAEQASMQASLDPLPPDPTLPVPPAPVMRPSSLPSWAQGAWSRFPLRVEIDARCVAHHESWLAGLWRAVNEQGSSASGFAQWIDGSWRDQAQRAGVRGYSRAKDAPPAIQAAVFAFQDLHYGLYPWAGSGCTGT